MLYQLTIAAGKKATAQQVKDFLKGLDIATLKDTVAALIMAAISSTGQAREMVNTLLDSLKGVA